jgi:hypothetical protein
VVHPGPISHRWVVETADTVRLFIVVVRHR